MMYEVVKNVRQTTGRHLGEVVERYSDCSIIDNHRPKTDVTDEQRRTWWCAAVNKQKPYNLSSGRGRKFMFYIRNISWDAVRVASYVRGAAHTVRLGKQIFALYRWTGNEVFVCLLQRTTTCSVASTVTSVLRRRLMMLLQVTAFLNDLTLMSTGGLLNIFLNFIHHIVEIL